MTPIASAALLAVLAGALVLVLLALYVTLVEPYRPVLRRIAVPVPVDWPQISILHLSDLHVKNGDRRLYRTQERFLRSLAGTPDLVCVTGDVCEQLIDAPAVAALLDLVRPRMETFVVLGNHEHDAPMPADLRRVTRTGWGRLAEIARRLLGARYRSSGVAEAHAIGDVLSEAGLRVLMNEGVRLDLGGRSLWVAGIDSVWSGCAQVAAALHGHRDGEPCLGLVHEPEGAPALIARGANLTLAGHTHGGQVSLPFAGAPYTLRDDPRVRVAVGLQPLGRGALHISAGLGHTTALRFNCPPEATWIECVPTVAVPLPAHEAGLVAEVGTALEDPQP
jgi:predicted MPP superfamily phosphohydrolase